MAALLAKTSVGPYVDAVAALVVALLVLRSASSLGWQTLSTILEDAPVDVNIMDIDERVRTHFAPPKLHHIHVWEIGPRQRLLTAHLLLGAEIGGCQIEALLAQLKAFLTAHWAIDHATIEPALRRACGAGSRRTCARSLARPRRRRPQAACRAPTIRPSRWHRTADAKWRRGLGGHALGLL